MIRTLVVKELRESVPLVALAALAAIYALAQFTGWQLISLLGSSYSSNQVQMPFAIDGFSKTLALVGGFFAAGLALKQAAWEDFRSLYHYILYRPIQRSTVIAAKMAVGIAIVLALAGLLLLTYALWAASPGKHASPFFWSMTLPAWQVWLTLPVVYLAAFLTGIRPARWVGTRLAPLVVGIAAAILMVQLPWWWATLTCSAVVSVLLVISIQHVAATRDY